MPTTSKPMAETVERNTQHSPFREEGSALFHCGASMRLNELSLLTKVTRISSVSGGSIAARFSGPP
jgi:NTE family protein